jgi:Xaa-Pro aminopeptidase
MTAIPPSQGDELAKARTELQAARIDVAVLSSIANVTYASGIEVPIPFGAGFEMNYGPWLAVVSPHKAILIAPKGAVAPERVAGTGFEVIGVEGWGGWTPSDPRGSFFAALREAMTEAAPNPETIGVEMRSLPFAAGEFLRTEFPNTRIVEAESSLLSARSIKTAREIALLRRASHLADISQTTLAELCREAGKSEFEMFAEISRRVFTAAGRDIPLAGELVTGPRTTTVQYPNGPRDRATQPGDAALMDLSGRCDGYWFDCTGTYIIGGVEPTEAQLRYGSASRDACEAAMAALKPGARASDAARAAEAAFASYGLPNAHYAGHQIGVTVNEPPRLVPYDETDIQVGMVFSVEPGAYEGPGGTFGARSEKMVLVTESGPEVLSTFKWGFPR